jgi:hypothetical protein
MASVATTTGLLRKMVDHRDGLIHGFDRPPRLSDREVGWALQTLDLLLQQVLLVELGWPKGEAGEMVHNSALGRHVLDGFRNPLLRPGGPAAR